MESLIAACGIDCLTCPAFIATKKNDAEEKKEIAVLWSTESLVFEPEDIHCDGCGSLSGKIMDFCRVCDVRRCSMALNLRTCAGCEGYPCDKLNRVWERSPEAKARLDALHQHV
jgi:hypothetical protein